MKLVLNARHPPEAHLIRGMLEAAGIRAVVKGDQLYGAFGELPVLPSVWVLDAEATERAERLIADFLRGAAAIKYGAERWACECGEVLEGQFTACWNCGALRPG